MRVAGWVSGGWNKIECGHLVFYHLADLSIGAADGENTNGGSAISTSLFLPASEGTLKWLQAEESDDP